MAVKTKAAILAEIASLLADNTTGDISASDIRTCLNDIVDSYPEGGAKVYKALLTQSGTNAPVATVLVNTLSGTPVWTRSSEGAYIATLTGEFTSGKTICPQFPAFQYEGSNAIYLPVLPSFAGSQVGWILGYAQTENQFRIETYDMIGAAEWSDVLDSSFLIEIEVYP